MYALRIVLSLVGLLSLVACGGGGASSATGGNAPVAGVATPAQVSVVTAN